MRAGRLYRPRLRDRPRERAAAPAGEPGLAARRHRQGHSSTTLALVAHPEA
ncbi:hypothetical protein LT493_12105 [Streptomyces tricolor]|nr:hypothetical protein [Streptomyces tricolor]